MSYVKIQNCLSLILLLIATLNVKAQTQSVPKLEARVTDLTSTLSGQQISALEAELSSFEQEKGSQVVVLIISTTDPNP